MENKEAEVVEMVTPAAEKEAPTAVTTVGEEAPSMESAKDRLRQLKDAVAGEHWVSFRNQVREAGEYAALRTRQGISMFGEPKIGAIAKIVDHC